MSATISISKFEVPTDGPTYIDRVKTRCLDLIDCGIWTGLSTSKLNQWWTNFRTQAEQYFAACLLDALIYRSQEQTLALMRQLVQRALPDLGRTLIGANRVINWEERFRQASSRLSTRVCLVPVVPAGTAQTKSAQVILRLFEKRLGVSANVLVKPEDVLDVAANGYVDAIVFVDDLLGTGTQFVEFSQDYKLTTVTGGPTLIYAPLVAHEKGIGKLNKEFPSLLVTCAELLDGTHALFDPNSGVFSDGHNTAQGAWEFYVALLKDRGIVLSSPRGFGSLELAFFFEHAAPDNCLPIFWWKNSKQWKPLVHR